MAERLVLKEIRNKVDGKYVGFTPNGSAVKPVHIASGVLRCIYGEYNTTMGIKRLALVSDAKGVVPKGNELETVYSALEDDEKLEESVSENALESLRNVMQRLLSADKGVYVVKGLRDDMISFTAGSKYFLTRRSIYEDAGEFIGGLIKAYCPKLADHIKMLLSKANDSISLVFEPVLEADMEQFQEDHRHEDIPAFININENTAWYLQGLKDSGLCLLENFKLHPNALTQLRLFNFFCIFQLIRYLTMLEAFYCEESIRPILLDFSGLTPSQSSVARASEISYTQMHKSINRFYAWGYAKWLEENGYDKATLADSETPTYESAKKLTSTSQDELTALWNLAKEQANAENENDARISYGETMYDMIALDASSHPVNYLKVLGTSSGILYPPDKLHPNKRFVLSQDVLEMMIRSSVSPNEIINGQTIRERLWNRFGVIIGGSRFELEKISKSGMIMQVDEDALEENFASFAATLEAMDFAEEMADGILQIRLGGLNDD